ncbi:PBECR4 domain-containing protein [Streptococcus mitis]|uniref:PBECR4 domain-containing protein n=1 Tax=Streptococcus mitis TaxID=28037 RepID=UPI0021B6113E|nr:PBECR4 domain-containing protein [Streptococcus mitis]
MPLTKAQAKSLDILEVARSLGMEMKRKSHREYYWAEHDSFKIDTVKNTWHWYSQNLFGDTINLVQQMRNVSYKEAMVFLETGSFPEAKPVEEERKPFNYTLAPYEQPFVEARTYLKEIRGLSDDTIDFFLEKGVLAQAKRKDKDGVIEDVLVFKYLDRNQQLVGASLQGLVSDQERHPGKGYLKQIMYQSESISGLNVSIGSPERLIVTEAPIDLMSYYELHKGELNDVRLVAMEGLKEGVLSHYVLEILQERGELAIDERDYTKSSELIRTSRFLSVAAEISTLFQDHKYDDLITLAVDRDKAGTDFMTKLREKKIPVVDARPPKREGQEKTDWNEILKQEKQLEKDEEIQLSSSFPDTSHLSPEDATWLKENWNNISFSVQSTSPSEASLAVEEKHPLDNQESITNTEENAGRTMSYEEVKRENEALTKSLNNRIQSGELSIEFAPDFYLYDVFAKLGNSHLTKYLNDKRMEVLSPIHSLLTSIDNQTIDLYKKKGTPEQDSLYQALKPHQRTMGVDISTQFIGELAIAAYNTNKQIESLSSDSFGVYFGERTLDNLSQSVERMLEYPLIESGTRDFAYGFVTTPNTLYHYLEEQEGEVVLNHELLDNLMSRLDTQPIKIMEVSEEKEKSLESIQETANNSEQNKKAETKLGDFPEESQVAAPLPEANVSQPLDDLSPSQTRSQPLLHFSINEDRKSIHKDNYHPISDKDLLKLNRYAPHLQNAAQWYLENVADSQVTYFYQDGADTNSLAIYYNKESFMHLTGIFPYREGQTAGQTLLDFATGNGQFDNILIANRGTAFDKLKVLPELPAIVDAESFYFGDLSDVEKFHSLNLDKAIRSNDQDVLLAFRTVDGTVLPASLIRLRKSLNLLLDQTNQEKIILGVFRERDGHIEQLSINEEYVKDKGAEMLSVLKNKQYEEIKLEEQAHNKQELKRDADADGVSDEEELLQGTNPYDFRSKPASKPNVEEELQAEEVVLATGSLAVADFIQNKDMAGLSRHLKEGIKEFLDSDKYKDYLTKMSHLNNYSNRNLRLILAQNPEASQVASFKQWKENFGRYVKKGEKALRIFKPMTKIKKDENNQPILDKNGKPETVTFFGLVPVFDVSQTEGKEMPKAAEVKEQLTDLDYANLYRALMVIAKENNVSVRFEEMENNKHGYYSVPENQIVLRSNDMNKAQIIKTFLHEMAHAELHHADNPQRENLTRSTAELQAESVAYVVSSYYGIDTSEYSFNYLSGWSADKETLADLEAQLDIVQQEAKSLMVRMDQALEQLRLSQEKQTKHSFEQKMEKFKNQSKQAVEEHKQELKVDAQSKKEKGFSK